MSANSRPVRVRFAPSPTGYLHLGNIRSAVFNAMFARKHSGSFILRIEDTDQKRHIPDSDRDICEVLGWLGLNWHEGPRVGGAKGPYYQTQRLETYARFARSLVDQGKAYYDFSTEAPDAQAIHEGPREIRWESPDASLDPQEAKRRVKEGEPHCIRMRVDESRYPGRRVSFVDAVRGEVIKDVEDFVIVKQNGMPTYHFGVVIDDHAMEISHVIRGFGHLDNTAKHAVLYDAFGWPRPVWAHHSNTAGLSKRKGSASVGDYMRLGYLPEAILNACLLMGWFPKDREEVFDWEARVPEFALEDLHATDAGQFDEDKFHHICQQHMMKVDPARLLNMARPFLETSGFIAAGEGRIPDSPERERLLKVMAWVRERITHAAGMLDELWAFKPEVEVDEEAREVLASEDAQLAVRVTREAIAEVVAEGEALTEEAFKAATKAASKSEALKERKVKGRGYFHPLRAALTGRLTGPELADVAAIVGREGILARLDAALTA